MPAAFVPLIATIASIAFRPKPPKPPSPPKPAPAPPPPTLAPLPTPPKVEEVKKLEEPTIKPEDAQFAVNEKQRQLKRTRASMLGYLLDDQSTSNGTISSKKLLGD